MKTLGQYKDEIKAMMKKLADIDAQCVTDGRELTEAELALKNEIMDKVDEHNKIVGTMERQARIAAALEKPAPAVTVQQNTRIEPVKDEQDKKKQRFGSFGEQLAAVVRASMPGNLVDPRLHNIRGAATGLNETVPSAGGFLVQTDFATGLLEDVYKTGILAEKCRRIQISGSANSIKINGVDETSRAATRSGGVLGYWIDEAGEKIPSKPKFRQIELSLKKLIGLCYATDELIADAAALEGFIRSAFVSEFGFLLDDAIIRGSGSGQPLGILNSGSLVSVAKESQQTNYTVVWENVVNMYSRLFATSRPNAVWLINQAIEPQLMQMAMAIGDGGVPVYLPAGGASQSPYATLFGRPVIPCEQCSAPGDVGDIIFGDFSKYLLAEKGGIESDMSIHVRFVFDESVFRFVLRVDGQPERATALTPYKGSATLSHFVALAERK